VEKQLEADFQADFYVPTMEASLERFAFSVECHSIQIDI
jgi:hypothetical protein